MAVLLAALATGAYWFTQIDDQIRRHVETTFAQHYPDLNVHVGGARLVDGQGIEIRHLTISDPTESGSSAELLAVEEVFIECPTKLHQLVQVPLPVERLVVRNPKLRLHRRTDGSWNVSQLWPLPKLSDRSPNVMIERGTIEWIGPSQSGDVRADPVSLHGIQLTLTPQPPKEASLGPTQSPIAVHAEVDGGWTGQTELNGTFDPNNGRWQLNGTAEGAELTSELCRALPVPISPHVNLPVFEAKANLGFQASGDPLRTPALRFDIVSRLSQGRVVDPLCPEPLTDLKGTIRINENECVVKELTAQCGPNHVRLDARRRGWETSAPATVVAHIEPLVINRELISALPEAYHGLWYKFQPVGTASADVKLTSDGQSWDTSCELELRDVAFTSDKFPYRLEHSTGTIRKDDDQLKLKLVAYADGQPIYVTGDLTRPGPSATGSARVWGENITAHDRIVAALRPAGRKVVESLNPAGTFHFDWNWSRDEASREPPRQELLVTVAGASIQYDRLPCRLHEVYGKIKCVDRQWTYDLRAARSSGSVECRGHLSPNHDLALRFEGERIPLDDELMAALPAGARSAWHKLAILGQVNFTAHVDRVAGQTAPKLKVILKPVAKVTSIEPACFPYRLEGLTGEATYDNGQVKFERIRGRHGDTTVVASGAFTSQPTGECELFLNDLSARGLTTDRDLLVALPPQLRQIALRLHPTGQVDLSGSVRLGSKVNAQVPIRSAWDLTLRFNRSDLNCGVPLDKVQGSVRLVGGSDGGAFQTRGELNLASLVYRGIPLTDVRGPFWADGRQIHLGPQVVDQPRKIRATVSGGELLGHGRVVLGEVPQFLLHGQLNDADLAQFSSETVLGRQQLKGKLFGNVTLEGTGNSTAALKGGGALHLREADLYELPVMVRLVRALLRADYPNKTAFTESDAKFHIQDNRIEFEQLDLVGNGVSLFGKGSMDMDANLQLAFHSNFRKSDLPLSFVRKVIGEASQQILQLRVTGPFDDPQITSEVFPGMNQALQQLQHDLERSTERQTLLLDPLRSWLRGDRGTQRR